MTNLKLFFTAAVLSTGIMTAQTEEKKTEEKLEEKTRPFQVTFISPIGLNGIESYKVTNNVSINILAGISRGVNGVEGAGLANITLKDVRGVQGAGITNVVLGNVKGVQGAGYFNYAGGRFEGAAFAGMANVSMHSVRGTQFAGFANFCGDSLRGVQAASMFNASFGSVTGGQAAGFFNYAHKDMTGIQAAGFANVALGNFKGAQLSAFGNVSVGNIQGVQASAFFNYAKKIKGVQLGFLNIADSVDGASIGFCSFVKKGLHQLEVSADELFYTNLSFRTGTHKFYNIFSVGAAPKAGNFLWQLGYGVGTSFRINDKLRSDINISAHHVSKGILYHATSEIYKLYAGVEYKLANKCFIAGGPTFNMYFSDTYLPGYLKTYSKLPPYSVMNETNTYGFNFKAWVGAKVAIRFL